jgi:hypothetical protein
MEDIFKDSNTVITPELNDFYSNSFLVKGNPADENVLPAPQVGGDNDDKANVRSLINKLNNISDLSKNNISNLQATYTDPLKDAKMFAFNPTYKGLNWDRYKSHSAFNELGFDPFRDNEKFYNDNTSIYSDITRGIQGFGKITASAFMNTAADLPRLLTGNWDPNTEAAKETERIMAETMSTRGTFGSSVINFGINAGFTVGIIGELIAEEMILGLAGLAGAPETGGASLGAAGYLMAVRAGLAGSKIAGLGKTTGALLKTIKNLDNAVDAKKYFNQFGRGAAEFLNPLQATTDLAKNFKNLNGLGQTARAAKSFGAFFKDIRDINRSFSEAKLEGGFVQNAMFEKLLNEAYANGKTPTPEEIDKIKEASLHAGYVNQMVNFPVIHYTNNIAFGNLVKPLNRLIGSTADSIKILNKTVTADITRKKVFQELAGGWKESLKRGFNPKLMAKNSLNYFSANLAEGLQESFQEASAIAIEDYYTKQFINENSIVRNQYELSILDSYGKGIGEQFSSQGAETFLSGFLMGGLMGRGGKIARKIGTGLNESSNKVKDLFYSKTDPEKYKEIKEKREIAKAEKEAKIKKYDEFRTNLINSLNDFYEDAGKMFSRDLAHMSAQEILDAKAKQAQETGDDKFLIDFTDASLFESVSNALYFGKFDLYLEHLDKIKSLDDQGLMEAMGIDDAQAGRQRLEVSIERAKEIKSRSKKFSENPYKYNDYKEGTDEYNEMVLMHNAFEDAKQSAIFTPYQFDRVLSRMNSIAESFSSIDLVANGNATEFLHLFGVDNILNEVKILDTEIQSLKDGTRENEALARRKEKQIKDLAEVRDAIIAHRAYFKALKETDTVDTSYEKNLKNAFIKYLGSYGENKSRILKSDKLDDAFKLFHDYYRLNIDAEYLSKSVAIVADPDFLRQESLRRYNALKKQYTNRKELIKKKWDTYLRKIGLNGVFQKLYEAGFAGDPEQMVAYNLSGGKTPVNLFYRISDFSRVTAADVEDIKKIKEIFDEYEDITGITKAKEEAAKKAAEAAAKKLEEEAEAARIAAKEQALDIYTPETKAKLVADYENYELKDTESFEEYLETPRAARIIAAEKQPGQASPLEPFSNIESFETAKGSVYTVLPDGRTQRFKTATNELNEPYDLIVFVKFKNAEEEQEFLEAQNRLNGQKLYIVDSEGNIYNTNKEALGKDVKLVIVKDDKVIKSVETSLEPKIGYNTFDQRRYEENGEKYRSTHLGNKVTKINYKTPQVTSTTTSTFEELKSKIEKYRENEEAMYASMSNPNDEVKKKKIYDVYDALITPLIREAKADIKARRDKDINSIASDPIKEASEYNAYLSKINDKYDAELKSLEKKEPEIKVEQKTEETSTYEQIGKYFISMPLIEEDGRESIIVENNKGKGMLYYINTDENGSVVSLTPKNKPEQRIVNEKLLTAVEIKRNKYKYELPIIEEVVNNESAYLNIKNEIPVLQIVENILNNGLTDEIAASLNKLYANSKLELSELLAIQLWANNSARRITNFLNEDKYKDNPNLSQAWENMYIINELASEKIEEIKNKPEAKPKDVKVKKVVEKTFDQLQRQRDKELKLIQEKRKELGIEFDPLDDLPESVVVTMERFESGAPMDPIAIDEASTWLYNKYKQVSDMQFDSKRLLTLKQIKQYLLALEKDIIALETYKTEQYGRDNIVQNEAPRSADTTRREGSETVRYKEQPIEETGIDEPIRKRARRVKKEKVAKVKKVVKEEQLEIVFEEPEELIQPVEEQTIVAEEEPIVVQEKVKQEFPISPMFKGKIIYFSPGLGKTILVSQYPDQFVDMDVLLYEEFKDDPGFENATPENIGEVVFSMYNVDNPNFGTLKDTRYNSAFKKAQVLAKQGKTVLTGSAAFISSADYSIKANNEDISAEQIRKKNPNITESSLKSYLKSLRNKQDASNVLLSVDKDSLTQFLMGNYDLLPFIDQVINRDQLSELGKYITSQSSKEVMEAFDKKMTYLNARNLLFSNLQPGDTIIILSEKTGKQHKTKIVNMKNPDTYNLEYDPIESSYFSRRNLHNLINVIPAQGTSEAIKVDEVDNSNAKDNVERVNSEFNPEDFIKLDETKYQTTDDDMINESENPDNCNIK